MRTLRSLLRPALLLLTLIAAGCSGGGGGGPTLLQVESVIPIDETGTFTRLDCTFTTVVYAYQPDGDTSFWLTDVPIERLRRIARQGRADRADLEGMVIHVELLWPPKAGATPMDSSATNVSIRHVMLVDGEVGIYAGAGFARPKGKPKAGSPVTMLLKDSTVRYAEGTDGFRDLLTPARLHGTFVAVDDPETARLLQHLFSQIVSDALGVPRWVRQEDAAADAPVLARRD